jgi:hypothetical protein
MCNGSHLISLISFDPCLHTPVACAKARCSGGFHGTETSPGPSDSTSCFVRSSRIVAFWNGDRASFGFACMLYASLQYFKTPKTIRGTTCIYVPIFLGAGLPSPRDLSVLPTNFLNICGRHLLKCQQSHTLHLQFRLFIYLHWDLK